MVLTLDTLLAHATLEQAPTLAWRFVWAYVAGGAVIALGLAALAAAVPPLRSLAPGWADPAPAMALTGWAFYGIPVAERLHQAATTAANARVALGVTVAGLVAYGLAAVVFRRLMGSTTDGAPAAALGLTAWTAAAGLAVNRNLVNYPLEPRALMLDALVVALAVGLAFAVRRLGASRGMGLTAALLALVALLGPPSASTPSAGPDRAHEDQPDLILILVDTLRYDVFRSVVEETPEGAAFRRHLSDAAWFDQAIAAAPWTAPSMGSILTGLYPQEHGYTAMGHGLDPNRPLRPLAPGTQTLAARARARGYHTEGVVTNPLLHPISGIARGFTRYELLAGATTKLPYLTVLSRLGWLDEEYYQPATQMLRYIGGRLHQLTDVGSLFLWLHFMDPHEPLFAHPKLPAEASPPELDPIERLYRDEVRYTLQRLSELFDLLEDHGRFEDSLLILVSDHGEMFLSDNHDNGTPDRDGTPKRVGHGHALYDELMHVPLVIRPPGGLPEERRLDILTSHVDLFDTAVDMLRLYDPRERARRLANPDAFPPQGNRLSLAPWLQVEPADLPAPERWALLGGNQQGRPQRGLRDAANKLILYSDDRHPELYDLQEDPEELRNIARSQDLGPWLDHLEAEWKRLETAEDTPAVAIDDAMRRRLEALGYVQ